MHQSPKYRLAPSVVGFAISPLSSVRFNLSSLSSAFCPKFDTFPPPSLLRLLFLSPSDATRDVFLLELRYFEEGGERARRGRYKCYVECSLATFCRFVCFK